MVLFLPFPFLFLSLITDESDLSCGQVPSVIYSCAYEWEDIDFVLREIYV